ncbi:hypothetical protein [Granulicella aggregans]|nr:hypothetical protein [Granulicella aggregans]
MAALHQQLIEPNLPNRLFDSTFSSETRKNVISTEATWLYHVA